MCRCDVTQGVSRSIWPFWLSAALDIGGGCKANINACDYQKGYGVPSAASRRRGPRAVWPHAGANRAAKGRTPPAPTLSGH